MPFILGMITSFLKLKPIPQNQQAILDILTFVKQQSQVKRGCLASAIYQEWDQDPTVLYLEQWESKEALDSHIQSNIYLRVLNAMDLCREKPGIYFYEISEVKGIEWIAALRLKNDGKVNN